jgi:hypothetical protein
MPYPFAAPMTKGEDPEYNRVMEEIRVAGGKLVAWDPKFFPPAKGAAAE